MLSTHLELEFFNHRTHKLDRIVTLRAEQTVIAYDGI